MLFRRSRTRIIRDQISASSRKKPQKHHWSQALPSLTRDRRRHTDALALHATKGQRLESLGGAKTQLCEQLSNPPQKFLGWGGDPHAKALLGVKKTRDNVWQMKILDTGWIQLWALTLFHKSSPGSFINENETKILFEHVIFFTSEFNLPLIYILV